MTKEKEKPDLTNITYSGNIPLQAHIENQTAVETVSDAQKETAKIKKTIYKQPGKVKWLPEKEPNSPVTTLNQVQINKDYLEENLKKAGQIGSEKTTGSIAILLTGEKHTPKSISNLLGRHFKRQFTKTGISSVLSKIVKSDLGVFVKRTQTEKLKRGYSYTLSEQCRCLNLQQAYELYKKNGSLNLTNLQLMVPEFTGDIPEHKPEIKKRHKRSDAAISKAQMDATKMIANAEKQVKDMIDSANKKCNEMIKEACEQAEKMKVLAEHEIKDKAKLETASENVGIPTMPDSETDNSNAILNAIRILHENGVKMNINFDI